MAGEMARSDPPPRNALSAHAPRYVTLQVQPDKIKDVVGCGGKTIRGIREESGVESIDIDNTGVVRIWAKSEAALASAQARVEGITLVPKAGDIFRNCTVKSLQPYGCFVELRPGKEGLVHVSELAEARVNRPEDVVSVGDKVDVQVLEVNAKGQMRLSCKALLKPQGAAEEKDKQIPDPNGRNGVNRIPEGKETTLANSKVYIPKRKEENKVPKVL